MEAVLEDMTAINNNLVLSFSLQGNINRYLLGEQPIAQIFLDIVEELIPIVYEILLVTLSQIIIKVKLFISRHSL